MLLWDLQAVRNKRRGVVKLAAEHETGSANGGTAVGTSAVGAGGQKIRISIEETMETFIRASEVFDPIRLPRQRLHWWVSD